MSRESWMVDDRPAHAPRAVPAVQPGAKAPAPAVPMQERQKVLVPQQDAKKAPYRSTGQIPGNARQEKGSAPAPQSREEQLVLQLKAAQKRAEAAEAALMEKQGNEKVADWKHLIGSEAGTGRAENRDDDLSAAAMEFRPRLSVQGGGGADRAISFDARLTQPLWSSPFDLSFRGYYQTVEYTVHKSRKERYSTTEYYYTHHTRYRYRNGRRYRYSYTTPVAYTKWHTRTVYYDDTETMESYGGALSLVLRPFRGKIFSPYASVGGRFDGGVPDDDHAFLFAWSAGGTLNLGNFWLDGKCNIGKSTKGVNGTIGYRVNRYLALNACVDWFDSDDSDSGLTGGGGATFVF